MEDLAEIGVIGAFLELEGANIGKVEGELWGKVPAERVDVGVTLLLEDLFVLFLLGGSLKALPRKAPLDKVHQDVAEGLQIIPPGLLNTEMSVETGVASSAGEALVEPDGNVMEIPRVAIPLGQAKVNQINVFLVITKAHHKVIGLDITMDKVLVVDVLDPLDHLVSQHQDSLETKPSVAQVEEVLQTMSKQVHDHGIVVTDRSIVYNTRNPS